MRATTARELHRRMLEQFLLNAAAPDLLAAADAVAEGGGYTTIKPAGQPAREVYAVPATLIESLRLAIARARGEE